MTATTSVRVTKQQIAVRSTREKTKRLGIELRARVRRSYLREGLSATFERATVRSMCSYSMCLVTMAAIKILENNAADL